MYFQSWDSKSHGGKVITARRCKLFGNKTRTENTKPHDTIGVGIGSLAVLTPTDRHTKRKKSCSSLIVVFSNTDVVKLNNEDG